MTPEPLHPPEPAVIPRLSLAARFRNYLFAGILITAPISITLYVTWSIVTWVDDAVARVLPDQYNPNTYLPFGLPGLGLLMLVVALTLIGFLTANYLGRTLLGVGERILGRMPLIRSVYSAIKQVFETVLKDRATAFREVVLLEYPRSGAWTVGLVIGRADGEVRDKLPEDMISVFVPTSPNPTTGFILFVPRADTIRLDMTADDALKFTVSGGLVIPPRRG